MTGTVEQPAAPAAVLFDMDGTLLDSEQLWEVALSDLATHYGRSLSPRTRESMVGRGGDESMRIFYRDLGLSGSDRGGDEAFLTDRMSELLATVRWRPGAAELVAAVRRAGLPTALVTSTVRRLVEVALAGPLGRDSFDVVVCGDEVTAPKPHPEPYRTAAARLGVPIDRCVAIEDSPPGLASAVAAGAVVLAVAGDAPLPEVAGVRQVESLDRVDPGCLSRLLTEQRAPQPPADRPV